MGFLLKLIQLCTKAKTLNFAISNGGHRVPEFIRLKDSPIPSLEFL